MFGDWSLSVSGSIPRRASPIVPAPQLRPGNRFWTLAAVAGVASFFVAFGVASASLGVSPVTLHGTGNYVHGARLTFFTQDSVWTSAIPATVPAAISTTVGTPTVLPTTGLSYVINAATAGDGAIEWNFTETTTPPHNTELELTFLITSGATPTNATVSVYLKTQAANPASTLTFIVYFDTGIGAAILEESVEVTQECGAAGACP